MHTFSSGSEYVKPLTSLPRRPRRHRGLPVVGLRDALARPQEQQQPVGEVPQQEGEQDGRGQRGQVRKVQRCWESRCGFD